MRSHRQWTMHLSYKTCTSDSETWDSKSISMTVLCPMQAETILYHLRRQSLMRCIPGARQSFMRINVHLWTSTWKVMTTTESLAAQALLTRVRASVNCSKNSIIWKRYAKVAFLTNTDGQVSRAKEVTFYRTMAKFVKRAPCKLHKCLEVLKWKKWANILL